MTELKKQVRRLSLMRLSATHGGHRNRRLVVTLIPGNGDSVPDLINIRPERIRQSRSITLEDLYCYLIRCEVNQKKMAKLRDRKAKKEIQRQSRAWKRELKKEL